MGNLYLWVSALLSTYKYLVELPQNISWPQIRFLCEYVKVHALPVPGGPYSNTPLGWAMPRASKSSGCLTGSSMTSLISLICLSRPPTISYVESGTFSTIIRDTRGSTCKIYSFYTSLFEISSALLLLIYLVIFIQLYSNKMATDQIISNIFLVDKVTQTSLHSLF